MPAPELLDETTNGCREAHVLELRGMELVGNPLNVGGEPLGLGREVPRPVAELIRRTRPSSVELLGLDCEQRQALTHVVVEVAGDPSALLLLGREEASAEAAQARFGPLPSSPFQQQAPDHEALRDEHAERGQHGVAMLLPQRGRTVENATAREAALVEAPAPELVQSNSSVFVAT